MHDVFTRRKIICAPIILRIDLGTPINNIVQERVGVRIVEMHLDHQAVFNHVFRKLVNRHHFGSTVNARGRPLNNERTASVVATRRTHRIYEGLMVRHQDFGFVLVVRIRCGRLVRTREKQVLVVVLEVACNLRPEILLAGVHGVLVGIVQLAFEPAVIPVDIENRHETCAHAHIDNCLHRIHPTCGNLVRATARNNVRRTRVARHGVRMAVPRTRNTHRAETCRLDRIDVGLGRELVAPPCGIDRHFHRITDVDTKPHLRKHLICCWKRFGLHRRNSRR